MSKGPAMTDPTPEPRGSPEIFFPDENNPRRAIRVGWSVDGMAVEIGGFDDGGSVFSFSPDEWRRAVEAIGLS